MVMRTLSPGGYEYLTDSVACADRELAAGESLAAYYVVHGYPAGRWFGAGAASFGVTDAEVTAGQMQALFGEGRHPDADRIETELLAAGATPQRAMAGTRLGRRFPHHEAEDAVRAAVLAAYRGYNHAEDRPAGDPIGEQVKAGIRQRVRAGLFATAHDGRLPAHEGELAGWLAQTRRGVRDAVSGYELVFAPPKSVSIAWALAGDEPTREVIAGWHRGAVTDTLAYLEANAAFTRAGGAGEAQVDMAGITAACFEHWDSRAGDPHLHTHVTISAKVQRVRDGAWTTLDSRTVHAATVTLSEFYNSRLRDLARQAGAQWVLRPGPAAGIDAKRGVWELAGVPEQLVAGFSTRARQVETDRTRRIVAFRAEHGREPTPIELIELGVRAQYSSRDAKPAPRPLAANVADWRAQAADYVPEPVVAGLSAAVLAGRPAPAIVPDVEQRQALAASVRAVVTDHHAHFTRWNIEAETHRQTAHLPVPPAAREQLINQVTDQVLADPETVALRGPAVAVEPAALRRASGESVFTAHHATRYTTTTLLRQEAELVEFARAGGGMVLRDDHVRAALDSAAVPLNQAQGELVCAFTGSGRRVGLALAPAGTGKTVVMGVVADAWRHAGGRVFAFGPSARAAAELGAAIDAAPHTLHQLTRAIAQGRADQAFPFCRGDLLLVDEAAMAGTHTLHTALSYALARGADVRLLGDDRQLGAVEAGGAVRLIAHDVGAARLTEVLRFRDRAQAAASLQLRDADPAGLAYYQQQGWVHAGSRESMREAALHAWWAELRAGRDSVLIVPTTDDLAVLNAHAREIRLDAGHVEPGPTRSLHDGTEAGVGDVVVTRANQRRLVVFGGRDFVKNGDTWTVTALTDTGDMTLRHRDHHGTVTVPADYTNAHIELGYAATVHRVQGLTVNDSAHLLVPPTLTRELLYPGLTRSRGENHAYVVTHDHVADDGDRQTPAPAAAEQVLTAVLARSGVPTSATEALRDALADDESLATLVARYNHAAGLDQDTGLHQLLTDRAPHTLHHPAHPALVQTLATAQDLGWAPDRLLDHALAMGDLDDAADPAAVLAWRIDRDTTTAQPPAARTAPALAWQARPDPAALREDPELADYLHALNTAIAARTTELAHHTRTTGPDWAPRLGFGPDRDYLRGQLAAYRETHHITSTDPASPLGPQPAYHGLTARAWTNLTHQVAVLTPPATTDHDIRSTATDLTAAVNRWRAARQQASHDHDYDYYDSPSYRYDHHHDHHHDHHQDRDDGLGFGR